MFPIITKQDEFAKLRVDTEAGTFLKLLTLKLQSIYMKNQETDMAVFHPPKDIEFAEPRTQKTEDDSDQPLREPVLKRSRAALVSLGVLFLAVFGASSFLIYGIRAAKDEAEEHFETRATEMMKIIASVWKEYEAATLSIHNICRKSMNTTRKEFREFYEYLLAGGLEFESAQCSPNVTQAERATYEEEARNYYLSEYPTIDYNGFIGFAEDEETGELIVTQSPELPFYFPVHYLEPVLPNAPAIDLDMYSFPSQKNEIDLAIATRQPVLSKRLQVINFNEETYSVIIYHPGIYLESDPDERAQELSLILVRITSLLQRVSQTNQEPLAVYLFDTTELNTGGIPEFLGAGEFWTTAGSPNVTILPESDHESFHEKYKSSLLLEKEIQMTASGTWLISVVPIDDTYEAKTGFVSFGAAMIFAVGVFVAGWILTAARRDRKMNELHIATEAEKAKLIIESAEQNAAAERDLNDFLAHEVRNPLAAATSACSFVAERVHEKQQSLSKEDITSVRDDVRVISSSLVYINDLLRNMLDVHKASSNQMQIDLKPASLLHDILEPTATILSNRDGSYRIEVDCDESLIVLTDRIRLRQIILNLASNSCKFVETGYIRIGAFVADGMVSLFIEDSGPGIPVEKRHNLFEKFQTSLDSLSQGTGVGLSLCKRLSVLLDAEIILDERFNSGIKDCPGSRFEIKLNRPPLDIEEGGLEEPNSSEDPSLADSKKLPESLSVLFVDDDVILRKMFSRAIKRAMPSWDVNEAANGETAAKLIEDNEYDVIFIDQYMASAQKQMLGTETVRLLRSKGFKGAVCGLSANNLEKAFLNAGANAFMAKPFPCEEAALKKELARVLDTQTIV